MKGISRRSLIEKVTSTAAPRSVGLLASPIAVRRSQAEVTPDIVTFAPDLEPTVRLIENTPRDRCASMLATQMRQGVPYRRLMAAVFLAGIRNVNPRPPGFALHCVFVIHSAHLLGSEAPADSRVLPLFYALDNFKSAQERDARASTGDYIMRPMRGALPSPSTCITEYLSAMEGWNSEQAERGAVSIARSGSAAEGFKHLWRYGARDYRNIGHKAIFVANAERTLRTIGWQHSEPVLRSLTLALLDFGKDQKMNGYALADQTYLANFKRVTHSLARLENAWGAKADPSVTKRIVKDVRTATPDEACAAATERLIKGAAGTDAVWDAAHLAAAELRMRVTGGASIIGVHAVTACNALHHAYLSSSDPAVRLLLLLQAVGWMGQFRTWAETRPDDVRRFDITAIEPFSAGKESESEITELFANGSSSPGDSAARIMHLARETHRRQAFLSTAVRWTLARAEEVHYYKYLAALVEDIPLVSAEWRPHLTAAVLYYTKGAKDPEPEWAKKAREALGRPA